jgi:hypothetical protein
LARPFNCPVRISKQLKPCKPQPSSHSVVELRFFGGLIIEEAAEVLGLSVARDEEKIDTLVRANGEILVHVIKLEHH